MTIEESIEDITCALSEDKHFSREPIVLTQCSHTVCKTCLDNRQIPIKCKICGEITERDLKNDKVSIQSKKIIKFLLSDLYSKIETRLEDLIQKFRNKLEEHNEKIELTIQYVEDEIMIRIESLKAELEELGSKFKNDLDTVKSNLIESFEQVDYFEERLKELKYDTENKKKQDEEAFYKYQEDIIKLDQDIKKFGQFNFKLNFDSSNSTLEKALIGTLSYTNEMRKIRALRDLFKPSISPKVLEIVQAITNNEYKEIELKIRPHDLFILPNNILLIISYDDRNITLYNENFTLTKTVDVINGATIEPYGIAMNESNQLYILDWRDHCVLMTDLDFNFIKSVGSCGSNNDQFKYPNGISYYNRRLYISDKQNKRIQILSDDLKFLNTVALEYEPWFIKVINWTLCVNSDSDFYFMDIDDFSVLKQYTSSESRINELYSCYFQSSFTARKLICYDECGDLIQEIDVNKFVSCISGFYDGCLVHFNGKVIISFRGTKRLIKID